MARYSIAFGLSLSLVSACSDMGGAADDSSSSAAETTGVADTSTGAELGGIELAVMFIDARSKLPLGGVQVCAADHDTFPCATTGADGHVVVELPAETEIMLACTIDTHVTTYMTLTTSTEDFDAGVFRLLDNDSAQLFVNAAGAQADPTKGIVIANVYEDLVVRDERVADATFTLQPAEGTGPFYGGALGLPDPSLEATSTGGPAAFFGVSPGEHTVAIAHPTASCTGGFGWATGSETSLRTRVFAGGMATVTFVCPP